MRQDLAVAKMIRVEHEAVQRRVDDLRLELKRLRAEKDPGQILGILYDFERHLGKHFRLEERGGLLTEGENLDPTNVRTERSSVAEHRTLERRLGRLVDEAERTESRLASLPTGFARELRSLLDDLRAHERAEDDLVQQVLLVDIGTGD